MALQTFGTAVQQGFQPAIQAAFQEGAAQKQAVRDIKRLRELKDIEFEQGVRLAKWEQKNIGEALEAAATTGDLSGLFATIGDPGQAGFYTPEQKREQDIKLRGLMAGAKTAESQATRAGLEAEAARYKPEEMRLKLERERLGIAADQALLKYRKTQTQESRSRMLLDAFKLMKPGQSTRPTGYKEVEVTGKTGRKTIELVPEYGFEEETPVFQAVQEELGSMLGVSKEDLDAFRSGKKTATEFEVPRKDVDMFAGMVRTIRLGGTSPDVASAKNVFAMLLSQAKENNPKAIKIIKELQTRGLIPKGEQQNEAGM